MTTEHIRSRGGRAAAAPPGLSRADRTVDEAIEDVWKAEDRRLLNFLRRRVGRQHAEELRSQVFMEFIAWWKGEPDHPSPKATLYRIAHCRAADHWRKSGRTVPADAEDLALLAERLHHDDTQLTDDCELIVDLGRIHELTARERQALTLRYVDDLPEAQCAAIMGLRIDCLKKILTKARQKLRQSPVMNAYNVTGTAHKEVRK